MGTKTSFIQVVILNVKLALEVKTIVILVSWDYTELLKHLYVLVCQDTTTIMDHQMIALNVPRNALNA
jgi:hypothetical protein